MMIVFAGIAVAGVLYALWPMLEESFSGSNETTATSGARDGKVILDQIEDLDLEYAAGKIPEDAYVSVRDQLVADAASMLRRASPSEPTASHD